MNQSPGRRLMRKSRGFYTITGKDTVPEVQRPFTKIKPDESYTNVNENSNMMVLSKQVNCLSKSLKQEQEKSNILSKRLGELVHEKSFHRTVPKCLDLYPEIEEYHKEKKEEEFTDQELIRVLEYRLEHAKLLNANARNKIHFLRKEQDKLTNLLHKEVGEDANFHMLIRHGSDAGWKGRSQKISILKNKITNLQARIEELQHGQRFDHGFQGEFYPTIMTREEDYLPVRAVRHLKIMDRNRQRQVEKMSRDIDNFLGEYEELKKSIKAHKCRNRILADDLKECRKQLKTYEAKGKEDVELIKNLMKHQRFLQETLTQEQKLSSETAMLHKETLEELRRNHMDDTNMLGQLKSLMSADEKTTHTFEESLQTSVLSENTALGADEIDSDVETLQTDDITEAKVEFEKCKTLLKISKGEKDKLEEMVGLLNKRLDEVTNQVIEAEKHCREQQCQIHELKRKLDTLDDKGKKTMATIDEAPKTERYLVLEEQLEVMKAENHFLRAFLQKAVMTKEEDFKLYQSSMEGVKRLYIRSLHEIKRQVSKTEQS